MKLFSFHRLLIARPKYSLPSLASRRRRRRRRRIIIMDTAANIASLSAMTPMKNRAWPKQYEVTPIHARPKCTAYIMCDVQATSHMHDVHVRQCEHSSHMYGVRVRCTCTPNIAHVRRTCAMNVYTIIHAHRTVVRRACTPYMYDSVNTALV